MITEQLTTAQVAASVVGSSGEQVNSHSPGSRSRPRGGVKGVGRRFPRRPASLRKEPTSVSKRVSPAERLRAEIDEVFAGGADLSRAVERVARLGAQLLLQSAVEAVKPNIAVRWSGSAPVARASSRMRSWRSCPGVVGRFWNRVAGHNGLTGVSSLALTEDTSRCGLRVRGQR